MRKIIALQNQGSTFFGYPIHPLWIVSGAIGALAVAWYLTNLPESSHSVVSSAFGSALSPYLRPFITDSARLETTIAGIQNHVSVSLESALKIAKLSKKYGLDIATTLLQWRPAALIYNIDIFARLQKEIIGFNAKFHTRFQLEKGTWGPPGHEDKALYLVNRDMADDYFRKLGLSPDANILGQLQEQARLRETDFPKAVQANLAMGETLAVDGQNNRIFVFNVLSSFEKAVYIYPELFSDINGAITPALSREAFDVISAHSPKQFHKLIAFSETKGNGLEDRLKTLRSQLKKQINPKKVSRIINALRKFIDYIRKFPDQRGVQTPDMNGLATRCFVNCTYHTFVADALKEHVQGPVEIKVWED